MTSHSDRYPQAPDHRPTQTDDPAATDDDSPRVAGVVPITVWRLDDRDDDQPATEPGAGFASRLARRLVLVYTRHGETVVDFDHDTYLHGAATATGRAYLAITEPARLADLDQISQPVSLVTLRWPRNPTPAHADNVADLFKACRLMMGGDARVIAAVRPGDPRRARPHLRRPRTDPAHRRRERRLHPRAADRGRQRPRRRRPVPVLRHRCRSHPRGQPGRDNPRPGPAHRPVDLLSGGESG
jgi:hypothetical protein